MLIAVDFDGTVVRGDRPYDDLTTPLEFMPGAQEALRSLVAAEHILLLWSARASLSLLEDPMLDPLVRVGASRVNIEAWKLSRPLHLARYNQMVDFVNSQLSGVFSAIDDGKGGKPHVDLFIDDRAIRLGASNGGMHWPEVARRYGAPVYDDVFGKG